MSQYGYTLDTVLKKKKAGSKRRSCFPPY